MNPRGARRLIDWIWTVRGSLPLAPGQSGDEAFARLDPLFREPGTTRRREGDAMAFQKSNPLSQDPMAVFDHGRLQIVAGPALGYELTSRALGFCFVAPAFFLGLSLLIETAHISGRVFAGFFAALYIIGRVLEARLVAARFARHLGAAAVAHEPANRPGPMAAQDC
jgi:hypothetical protein